MTNKAPSSNNLQTNKPLRLLQIFTFYDYYLRAFYERCPALVTASYEHQQEAFIEDGFCGLHILAPHMKGLGYDAEIIIANSLPLQLQWADKHGVPAYEHSWQEDILRAQINHYKPDVLYTLNPLQFDSSFIRSLQHHAPLVVGWRAAEIPQGTDWSEFDLILSHLSVCREQALRLGAKHTEFFHPGVSERLGRAVEAEPKLYDVVFIGQWTPQHRNRNELIASVAEMSQRLGFSFGLFLAADPRNLPPNVAAINQGDRWGIDTYKILRQGRIVLNAEIDMAKGDAGNHRFFETLTCGSFLLTENQSNITDYLDPGYDLEVFSSVPELEAKIVYYLKNDHVRERIADNGKLNALKKMSLPHMARKLDCIFRKYLKNQEIESMGPQPNFVDLALQQLELNNLNQALSILHSAPPLAQQQRNLELVRSRCLMGLGRINEARRSLELELERFPDNNQARALLRQLSEDDSQFNRNIDVQQVNQELQSAVQLFQTGKPIDAMRILERINTLNLEIPGFHYFRTLTLSAVGRYEEALEAVKLELKLNPGHDGARAEFEVLSRALAKKTPPPLNPEQRSYSSAIPPETLKSIHNACDNYKYRGVPMTKSPFDFAIYPLLLWEVKPRTIIEIGSRNGGSAIWFGDLLDNFGIEGHVYSLDIVRVDTVAHKRVTFLEVNGRELEKTLTPEFLNSLPRPLLVIEDADHSYETSCVVLKFFHPYLKGEEYIVIEDGIISDLSQDPTTNSGPHRAIKEFIANNPGEYDSDSRYSDFFGYNFTWGSNGFLRKKKYPINSEIEKRLITEFNQDDPAPLGIESQMCVNERFQVYLSIRALLEGKQSYTFIEVGSYSGASFSLIHAAFQRLGSPFRGYSVEPGGTPQFYEVMSRLNNVEHLRMLSDKAAPVLSDRLHAAGRKADFIMIDGDHSYEGVRNDIINYYPLLERGGIMMFHDYLPELTPENREAIMFHHGGNEPGIRQACRELMENQYRSELVELPLLYPTDPTQTQPHLPVIPGVMSTIRAYRKN